MANLILAVKELEDIIDRVTPAVEAWATDLSDKREKHYADRRKALDELSPLPTESELRELATLRRKEFAKNKGIFQITPPLQHFCDAVYHEHISFMGQRRIDIAHFFAENQPDPDNITPVLSYLTQLCKRLDRESLIMLSANETFQIERATSLMKKQEND